MKFFILLFQCFKGNVDSSGNAVEHTLPSQIIGRFIRLNVVTWGTYAALRWEVYGSQGMMLDFRF